MTNPSSRKAETGARQPTEESICHTQTAKGSHLLAFPVTFIFCGGFPFYKVGIIQPFVTVGSKIAAVVTRYLKIGT